MHISGHHRSARVVDAPGPAHCRQVIRQAAEDVSSLRGPRCLVGTSRGGFRPAASCLVPEVRRQEGQRVVVSSGCPGSRGVSLQAQAHPGTSTVRQWVHSVSVRRHGQFKQCSELPSLQ